LTTSSRFGPAGRARLDAFITALNAYHPTIKFTASISDSEAVFLDTACLLREGHIETDLYTKPTDRHQYLHARSCHPSRCKRAIPFGLTRRLQRICSTDEALETNVRNLEKFLVQRGYDRTNVQHEIFRARTTTREECLTTRRNANESRLPLITTYHPFLPNLAATLHKHHDLLSSSDRLVRAFPEPPVVAYRRPKNLRDLLVHATLQAPQITAKPLGTTPCRGRGCKTCSMILPESTKVVSHTTKASFPLQVSASCKTSDIIYLLQCRRCSAQYVGETGQPLHARLNSHRSDVKHRRTHEKPVAVHYTSHNHTVEDMKVLVLECMRQRDPVLRKIHEAQWIRKLASIQPHGLNLRIDSL